MARRLVLGQARIFTNKSDMKPVPLWVLWEKGKDHYVTEQGCIPLGLAW